MKGIRLLSALLSLALACTFAGCKPKTDPALEATIHYNLEAEPSSLDPQIADDEAAQIVIMGLFEGLTRIGEDGAPLPGAAERWEHNADYTEFTFYLREGAKWTDEDESPVTAKDFVFGIRRALDPDTKSSSGRSLACILNGQQVLDGQVPPEELGVTAVSDQILKIDLAYPYEEFPELMAASAAMPCNEKFFTDSKGQYGLESNMTLGNGPYAFTNVYSWDHNKSISLSRNSLYMGNQKPVPAGISFTIGAQIIDNANAIINGTIDAAPITGDQLAEAHEGGLNLTSFEDTTWGVVFNLQDDVFKNSNVRAAFLQTLDRAAVVSSLPENYTEALSVITPLTELASENYREMVGEGALPPYTPEEGKAFLVAGLNELQLDGLPKVTILCQDSAGAKALVNNMLENWNRSLGQYFNLKAVSLSELQSAVKNGNYQVALAPLRAENDGPAEFLNIFQSDHPNNPAGLQDAAFDERLSQIKNTPGEAGAPLCLEAENYLTQNHIFYPLVYEKRYFAAAKNVTGIIFHPYNGGIDFISAYKAEKP